MKPILFSLLALPLFCNSIKAQDSLVLADGRVFEKVEIEAAFPGGEQKWVKYLQHTINADIPLRNHAPSGIYTVLVQFVVDKEGNISKVAPLTDFGFGMEEEVVRIINSGPKWMPAVQDGKQVKAYRKQPVTFQVDQGFTLNTYRVIAGQENNMILSTLDFKANEIELSVSAGKLRKVDDNNYVLTPLKTGKFLITAWSVVKRKRVEISSIYLVAE
jgi:hypothetical protein